MNADPYRHPPQSDPRGLPQSEAAESGQTANTLSAKERYEIARAQIEHEDGLVNSRVTWLQVFQGLLFAAFASGISLFKSDTEVARTATEKLGVSLGLGVLAVMGILSSVVAYAAVKGATQHLRSVEKWWMNSQPPVEFPPVRGQSGFKVGRSRVFGAPVLLAFAAAWFLIIAIFLFVALSKH